MRFPTLRFQPNPLFLPLLALGALLASIDVATAETQLQRKKQPADAAMSAIEDVEGLPRVLLIGDSISIGYTQPVRDLLSDKANVHRPLTNCSSSGNGLANLDKWLGKEKWDVIHFNFGLHDAKLPPEGNRHAPPDVYETNLRELVKRLQKTGAKLIFATTTPVPNGGVISPTRRFGSVQEYNAIALKVMKDNGVSIDDLNATIAPELKTLQIANDVHFTKEGSLVLAKQVAQSIEEALAMKPTSEQASGSK